MNPTKGSIHPGIFIIRFSSLGENISKGKFSVPGK